MTSSPLLEPPILHEWSRVDLLFAQAPAMESIRQWMVLVFSWVLIGLFAYAIFKLYKTQRQITFDCVILAVEAVKVRIIKTD